MSGDSPLPGASIKALSGDKVVAISSTDENGAYSVPLTPGTYTIRAELTAFANVEKSITVGQPPCDVETKLTTMLVSRAPASDVANTPAPVIVKQAPPPAPGTQAQNNANGNNFGGRGGGQGGRGQFPARFTSVTVSQTAEGATAAAAEATTTTTADATTAGVRADDPAARLLPAGFSLDAPPESVTVSGTFVEVDRNLMAERLQSLARGEFGLGEGQFGQPGQGIGGLGGLGGGLDQLGGAGGAGGGGGRGGAGGPGGGGLGGRIGGASRIQASATYGFGSSLLDSRPFQLRDQAVAKRDYDQNNASVTLGGPVKIPGLYPDTTNRTTFNFTYSASRNGSPFDQFATVPSVAFRNGDFSASPVAIIDPTTGQPFPNNQIPQDRISPAARVLMGFIPTPTLDGAVNNWRYQDTTQSSTDSFALRITHTLIAPAAQAGRGGRGGAAGGAGGRAGATAANTTAARGATTTGRAGTTTAAGNTAAGTTTPATGTGGASGATPPATGGTTPPAAGTGNAPVTSGTAAANTTARGGNNAQGGGRAGGQGGGRAGGGGRGNQRPQLTMTMNATVNYRRNDGNRVNVFPLLGGTTDGSTLSVPVSVNARYGRSTHQFGATFSQTRSTTLNNLAFLRDVAGEAGINGVSSDPFDWGVPSISFSGGFSGIRDIAPSKRTDRSYQTNYTWTRSAGQHNYRFGANYSQSSNVSQSDSNARGNFTFSGLYTANGLQTVRGSGQDFADFLLGMPQNATRQYSVNPDNIVNPITIEGKQFGLFLQDDWRWKARWTINYGLQWDVIRPYTEASGHMVNLDANGDFTAVAPVESGETGPFSGVFPSGLVKTDWNNVSPRIGAAWRASNRSVVRFGYSLTYNAGAYNTIARNLYQQPPFFLTATSIGTIGAPLSVTNAFANISPSTVTNNYGIDENYVAGLIHQWTVDINHDLGRTWATGVTYAGTRGSDLDMLRAPNRGPNGLRIAGVQAFTWQSSEGSSHANALSFRLQMRQTKGVSATVTYTLAKSLDNTTATGGGASLAQDDQNLGAEWALSNFDQRHALSANSSVQLPWGANRKWLASGGWLSHIVGDWSMSANFSMTSGSPLTVRCSSCAAALAGGVGGTLRADYTGQPITISNPTIDQFFNTAAFAIPVPGTFGNSARNIVVGPGSKMLNAQFTRDVRLGGNRSVSINVNASNLLNLVNYRGLNTDVNSLQFGQITSLGAARTIRLNLRFRF